MSKKNIRKLHLFIDMDEVTADLMTPWITWINETYNLNHKYEDIAGWEIDKFVECGKKCYAFLEKEGIYVNLEAVPGAIKTLNLLQMQGHKITFVTAPPKNHEHAKVEKIQWLTKKLKWFNPNTDIIFSHDKADAGIIHKADILLDDRAKWLYEFEGLAVAFDRPWNQHYNGLRVKTWDEFKTFIDSVSGLSDSTINKLI